MQTNNRGITLPGGHLEPGETFREAAHRELKEETGIVAKQSQLLFHAYNDGYYIYVFLVYDADFSNVLAESEAGKVLLDASKEQLMDSKFRAFYDILFEHYYTSELSCLK